MSHFAKVLNGKVVQIIVAEEDFFNTFVDWSPGHWIKTSYNTTANKHTLNGTPLRGNFAEVGSNYDSIEDAFYGLQPFPSWILNKDIWMWEPPISYPTDGKEYLWDEELVNWKEFIT